MDANSPNASRRAAAAERRKQAVALRIAGATFEQIGERLGITKQAAFDTVSKALEDTRATTAESAETLRQMELQRLDALQTALWSDAVKGDVQAVDRVLKVMLRRSQLIGLDAPTVNAVIDWRAEIRKRGGDPDALLSQVRDAILAHNARLADQQRAAISAATNDDTPHD